MIQLHLNNIKEVIHSVKLKLTDYSLRRFYFDINSLIIHFTNYTSTQFSLNCIEFHPKSFLSPLNTF